MLAGCYSYAPIEPATTRPGMDVRARITGAMADQLQPLLGSTNRLLTGKVLLSSPDTLLVEVPTILRAEVGSSIQTLHQRVAIPRTGLVEMESRKLDRARTYALTAAGTLLVGGFIIKATVIDPGKEKLPGGGPSPELRIPLILLRMR
jgi:hypothetical protein